MPRIEFSSENKVATTNYDYPKLKLKSQERARIVVLEAPVMEYVHTLRAPTIQNGVPVMFTDKRRDGTEFQANKMDFLSRPLCLGDASILADAGSDPKNCPMCKLAKDQPDMTQPPMRRYAMHVVRYRTKGGGFELVTPFSVETVVWSFTDKVFNKLSDLKEEYGDLRKHDLLLGPCTNETFQQFDIMAGAKGEWIQDDERKSLTVRTFQENQIPDLTIACGSVKELRWIEEDLSVIRAKWAEVNGVMDSGDTTSLTDDISSILDSKPAEGKREVIDDDAWLPEKKNEADSKGGAADFDDLLKATSASAPEDAPETAPEATPEASDEAPKEAGAENFDDLLKGLN